MTLSGPERIDARLQLPHENVRRHGGPAHEHPVLELGDLLHAGRPLREIHAQILSGKCALACSPPVRVECMPNRRVAPGGSVFMPAARERVESFPHFTLSRPDAQGRRANRTGNRNKTSVD